MDSSQVFFANSILLALIHDIDLKNPFHGEKTFVIFVWERLPAGLGNYVMRLSTLQ